MLCFELRVVRSGNGANRVRYLPKQLFSTFAVPKELNWEDLGQPFGLAA